MANVTAVPAGAPLEGIDLNLLVILREVLRQESVSQAARSLGTSQPSVSRALASLRRVFRDELVVRAGRGIALTPLALSLREPIEQILAGIEQLRHVGAFNPIEDERMFRVRMPDVLGVGVVPELAKQLDRAPGVSWTVLGTEGDPLASLLQGRCDIVIAAAEIRHPDIVAKVLPTEDLRWSVVFGRKHPAYGGPMMTRARWLKSEHLQLVPEGRPDDPSPLDRALAAVGEVRRLRAHVSYLSAMPSTLEHSSLVATLPTPTARWVAKGRRLRVQDHPLKQIPSAKVRMAWHIGYQRDSGHRWFRELLVECLAQYWSGPV